MIPFVTIWKGLFMSWYQAVRKFFTRRKSREPRHACVLFGLEAGCRCFVLTRLDTWSCPHHQSQVGVLQQRNERWCHSALWKAERQEGGKKGVGDAEEWRMRWDWQPKWDSWQIRIGVWLLSSSMLGKKHLKVVLWEFVFWLKCNLKRQNSLNVHASECPLRQSGSVMHNTWRWLTCPPEQAAT